MSMLRIPNLSEVCAEYPPADPAISYTFPLDPFQQWAVAALHREENVLVTAKTGSGKTLVAEYAIAYQLKQGRRVFYTTPIKSLSNQKYHDMKKLFPAASVGILTGDIKSNPDAQIVIMTTEILRNLLFKSTTATATLGTAGAASMENVGAVVFDEVHYINDVDRGHVWEECLILMPPAIRLVLLSATIDQPEAFAEWLGEIKQVPCWLLATTYRIVPLVHSLWNQGLKETLVLKDRDEAQANTDVYRAWLRNREAMKDAADDWKRTVGAAKRAGESAAGREGKVKLQSFQHQLNECITTMRSKELLPALFFSFSRKECERFADKVAGSLLDSSEEADVKHILSFHLHRYGEELQRLPQYVQIVRLLERGIAFHHSGLLPVLKEIVELLFAKGFVRVLFCTESLAIGVNLPARSVVFTGLEKPCGDGGFRPLRYDEYAQMAGRAGRRGKDTRGYVFYLPAREPLPAEELRGVMSGSLPTFHSRIQFHYDFVLKALHLASTGGSNVPLWETLLSNSYWTIQRNAVLTRLAEAKEEAEKAVGRSLLSEEQRAAFAERDDLELKARTLTNAKQKAAKLALRKWQEEHTSAAWRMAETQWARLCDLQKQLVEAETALRAAESGGIQDRIGPVLEALESWGFIEQGQGKLSHMGVLATEVNEGNPILIPKLYESGLMHDKTAEEIVATLATFILDGIPEDSDVTPFPAAKQIHAWAEQGRRLDYQHCISSPPEFWNTHPFWGAVVNRWLEGVDAGVVVQEFGIFEGNLMRTLLKVNNLLQEWTAMATFCGDVTMLDKLKNVQILRGVIQPESIYLRL
jgi:superfamily II RNA helicase